MTRFEEVDKYISEIPRFAAKTGTENLQNILAALGNPEKKVKSIHIAGTNGKGSVCRLLSLMLEAAGQKTGLFISPHLEKINERISINGQDISDRDFVAAFDQVKECLEAHPDLQHPSFFEYLFLMATIYFAQQECKYVIYETGLGGRLDATNVLAPMVTGISSIGMDHMQYLGNTLEEIAGEKAGIIKEKTPVMFYTGSEVADKVIRKVAAEKNASCMDASQFELNVIKESPEQIDFSMSSRYYDLKNLSIHSGAHYQLQNVALAVIIFEEIQTSDFPFHYFEGEEWIKEGINRFEWPGRMEWIQDNILLDGAHNENAAKALLSSLENILPKWKKKALLFAVSRDKDYQTVTKLLSQGIDPQIIYVAELDSERKTDHETLDALFTQENEKVEIRDFTNVQDAMESAVKELPNDCLLIITGSLYLAGEVRTALKKKGQIHD